jgi:hypothetical protein
MSWNINTGSNFGADVEILYWLRDIVLFFITPLFRLQGLVHHGSTNSRFFGERALIRFEHKKRGGLPRCRTFFEPPFLLPPFPEELHT